MYNNTTNILESFNPGEALSSMSASDYKDQPWSDVRSNPQVAVEYRPDIEKVFSTCSLERVSDGEESELIHNGIGYKLHTPRQVRTARKPLHSIGGTFPHETENRRISVGRVFDFFMLILRPSETSSEMCLDADANGGSDINDLIKQLWDINDPECIARCENELAPIITRFISLSNKRKEILKEGA